MTTRCFKAAQDVAQENGNAIPMLIGDHNVEFTHEVPAATVVPLDWIIAPGRENKLEFVFCPSMDGQLTLPNSCTPVLSHDHQHWSLEVFIRWQPASTPNLKRGPTTEAFKESQCVLA